MLLFAAIFAATSFYDLSDVASYKGQVALVVNTASKCGFTPQLSSLQKVFDAYKAKGFVVLGFPSDDFRQEPGSDKEIQEFCELKYRAKFPLFKKAAVKGEAKQPVYKHLVNAAPEGRTGEVAWNFEKFLIARDGKVAARFPSEEDPAEKTMRDAIEAELAKK